MENYVKLIQTAVKSGGRAQPPHPLQQLRVYFPGEGKEIKRNLLVIFLSSALVLAYLWQEPGSAGWGVVPDVLFYVVLSVLSHGFCLSTPQNGRLATIFWVVLRFPLAVWMFFRFCRELSPAMAALYLVFSLFLCAMDIWLLFFNE